MTTRSQEPRAAERRGSWLALSELQGAALPSPVRKLLARISDELLADQELV